MKCPHGRYVDWGDFGRGAEPERCATCEADADDEMARPHLERIAEALCLEVDAHASNRELTNAILFVLGGGPGRQ